MNDRTRLYLAECIVDSGGIPAASNRAGRSPGAALVALPPGSSPYLLTAGSQEEVESHPRARNAERVRFPGGTLLPGLVNAHTHLDLTHIGPREFDVSGGFVSWAGHILRGRHHDPEPLRSSVRDGIARSLRGGVIAIGDIAGDWHAEPIEELQASGLLGVSFLEFFGMGGRQKAAIEKLEEMASKLAGLRHGSRVAMGLQPHAPYTVGSQLYEWTARRGASGWPVATHLAENPGEREFVGRGTGPFRELLEKLQVWDASVLEDVGRGLHPIDHFAAKLRASRWLLAHVNDCPDAMLSVLAAGGPARGTSIAYCPRSSAYFRNHEHFGPHRYREMLAAGINVALGTDSVVNLSPEEAGRISVLDEMRFLHARDGTDPRVLLEMATVNGARALGLDSSLFTLVGADKPIAGLICVAEAGTLEEVVRGKGAVSFVLDPVGREHILDGGW